MDIHEEITKFAKREREEAEKAKENEEKVVCVDPDSYIAKEIKYQTAIAHQILEETRQQTKMLKEITALIRSGGSKEPQKTNDFRMRTQNNRMHLLIVRILYQSIGENGLCGC